MTKQGKNKIEKPSNSTKKKWRNSLITLTKRWTSMLSAPSGWFVFQQLWGQRKCRQSMKDSHIINAFFQTQQDYNTTSEFLPALRSSDAWLLLPLAHRLTSPLGQAARFSRWPLSRCGPSLILHNHSQLVFRVTARSGCPEVVMVEKWTNSCVKAVKAV